MRSFMDVMGGEGRERRRGGVEGESYSS